MLKVKWFIFFIFLIYIRSNSSFSQRILFQSDFENITLSIPDSIPTGWAKLDADSNFFGIGKGWAVRDTNQILGGDTIVNRPRSHSGKKSLHIPWFSGKGGSYESDDWVWSDSLRITDGDSLIFWSLLGNIRGISFYVDSLQIWICSSQNPNSTIFHLATLVSSLDTNTNTWIEHKFNLSQFSGQRIYIAFRYYLPVQNALWCNIDDMIIGNRSFTSSIKQIESNIPSQFSLIQNYPNPFNPNTKIKFDIPDFPLNKGGQGVVLLKIYDALGKEIITLVNQKLSPGSYEVNFDGSNLSSGIYFYRIAIHSDKLETESAIGRLNEVKKMLLIK